MINQQEATMFAIKHIAFFIACLLIMLAYGKGKTITKQAMATFAHSLWEQVKVVMLFLLFIAVPVGMVLLSHIYKHNL